MNGGKVDIIIFENLLVLIAMVVFFALAVAVIAWIEARLRKREPEPTQSMDMESRIWNDINEIVGKDISRYE
jgi:hypothetical protein